VHNFEKISLDLRKNLALEYEPVGVNLYKQDDLLPSEVPAFQGELKSYCQGIALAGKGKIFLVKKEHMGCKLGTTVLGFEDDVERYLDDGILEKYGVGLFASEKAASETILNSPCLEKGKTLAALIAPLSSFKEKPQVIVFTSNSEQAMWLLYAVNYEKGGRVELPQSGGALGGCADITVFPLVSGKANITLLGLGCRIKSALGPCSLMLGISGSDIETVHRHILALEKPIGMLTKARQQ
jgi:uncharacterized protein (DUF169 family)